MFLNQDFLFLRFTRNFVTRMCYLYILLILVCVYDVWMMYVFMHTAIQQLYVYTYIQTAYTYTYTGMLM